MKLGRLKQFFLFLFISQSCCLLCSTAFQSYFNNQIQNQIVSSKTFFRFFLFPQTLLVFFWFCYCSFVCAGRPCLESSCCHGNGRMAFCSGLNSKNRAEKKNIALQLSLLFLFLSLYAYERCKWSSEEKSVFNSHTSQTFVTLAWIKWLFALSDLYHLTGSTSLSHFHCPMEIKIKL